MKPTAFNFGDQKAAFSTPGSIPEADYAIIGRFGMHQATDKTTGKNKGPNLFGLMVKFHPLEDGVPVIEKFFSFGKKAAMSFVTDDEGKTLSLRPDAVVTKIERLSNYRYFQQSMYDGGMPEGFLSDDISVMDWARVHIISMPTPEERKNMATNSAMAEDSEEGGEANAFAGKGNVDFGIPVIGTFLDGGKPWEGACEPPASAGVAAPVKGKAAAPAAKATTTAKPNGKPAPVAEAEEADDTEFADIAESAVGTVMANPKNKDGLVLPKLRMQVLAKLKKDHAEDKAQAVFDGYVMNDVNLSQIAEILGFVVKGGSISPA